MNTTQETITDRLDDMEASLPTLPSKTIAFGRATARRTTDAATTVVGEISDRAGSMAKAVSTATKTTAGQARSAAERTAQAARRGFSEATGQAAAQAERAVDTIESETAGLLDDATSAVDPVPHDPASFDDLNKAELYAIAQQRDVEGRGTMSKSQLIRALRK